LTVIVIPVEVAGEPETHAAFEVISTVTTSLLAKVVVVNVEAVSPETSVPFIFHWYVGEAPPLVGVAVKVTLVPAQIAPDGTAAALTLAVTFGLTVIVIPDDVAGEPETHAAFEVISTVTTSLLAKVVVVNVEAVSPETGEPLTDH
jgi:hypothetical protein